jgi:hypothetical protein
MSRSRAGLMALLAAGTVLAGVVAVSPRVRLVPMLPGAIPLATHDFDPGSGPMILCTLGRALDPVFGRLAGDESRAPHAVWLVAADGREVQVLWPRHFTARFSGGVELIARDNVVVAHAGDPIDLNIGWEAAAGTIEDPYEVWWVNHECYPPVH